VPKAQRTRASQGPGQALELDIQPQLAGRKGSPAAPSAVAGVTPARKTARMRLVLTLDANDPDRLAEFWSAALGYERHEQVSPAESDTDYIPLMPPEGDHNPSTATAGSLPTVASWAGS